jgi:hypothetical protein
MRAVFFMSLVSGLLSLLAVLALSAITIVPRPGAETFRAAAIGVGATFFFVWLAVAFWARKRWRAEVSHPVPPWLRRVLLGVSAVYSLIIVLGILG